jgi:hypothetical protein
MSVACALAVGTVLNLAAVAALARAGPGPVRWPHISARHPLAAYRALAAAPFGNGPALFALAACIYTACLYVAARRHACRHDRRSNPP